MKLTIRAACAALPLFSAIVAFGQTGYVTVTESHVMDAGVPIANGTVNFYPVDNNGNTMSYRVGSATGGQVGPDPITATVTSGAYTISLPDSELTFPVHACYKRVIIDNSSGQTLSGPGYTCVQVSNQVGSAEVTGGWCTASGGCNLDHYPPNQPSVALVETGPQGPAGPTGPAGPAGPPGGPSGASAIGYGAKGDAIIVTDANLAGGTAALTTTTSTPFNCSTDVGKAIGITGAAAYQLGNHNTALQLIPNTFVTTIASCQANDHVTLTATAPDNTGVVTALTYTSGLSVTGSAGQTCLLSAFNNSWTGGTGTVTLTGTNTIATGTPILITAQGSAASPAPTSATGASGTATCSGTATVAGTLAPISVSGQWMAVGTDDTAVIKACIAGTTDNGGTCILDDGYTFMVSNTSSTVSVSKSSGIEGGTISGRGKIVFMPQGSLVGGSNDRLFFLASSIGNSTCTSGGAGVCAITNAPLAKGATSFTTSSTDGTQVAAGQWIIIEEVYSTGGCCNYIDWAKVASVSTAGGTSTVNLTQPLEMAFPADTNNSIVDTVGFRPVNNLVSHLTLRDFTVVTPMLYDQSTGRWANTLNTEGTYGLTIKGVKCWNASKNCLATDYDNAPDFEDNYWHIEGIGTEIANSVHGVITGNHFAKEPSAINQYQSVCAGGFSPSGLNVDLATAWFSIANNQVDGCQVGQYLLQGAHDNTVNNNKYSWMAGPVATTAYLGLAAIGTYNNLIEGNNFVGANGSVSTGVLVEDSGSNPHILSNNNQALFNIVDASHFTTAYSFVGASGGDCYLYLSGGGDIGTCLISPTGANTFSGTNTFWNNSDATYNAINVQAGKTAAQIAHVFFSDYNGTHEWDFQKDASNGFRFIYSPTNLAYLLFNVATGQTTLNSSGTNNICLNCVANSGTGGVQIYSGGASPSQVASIDNTGKGTFSGGLVGARWQATLSTPASSSDTCTAGQVWADASYAYVCTATNTIKRAALSTF